MNDKIPCDMIQDLLPLYVEGLTRKTTAGQIRRHLDQCLDCRESLRQMEASMAIGREEQLRETRKEIDYLKAVKTRNIKRVVGGVLLTCCLMAAVLGVKLFILGSPSESYMVTYLDVDERQIHVGGTFWGSASVYAGHKLVQQPDGSQKLVIRSCLASAWNRRGVFNLTLDLDQISEKADIGGTTVMRDGSVITRLANELYAARNPFIGDASADGRLAGALKLGERLGDFTNELQTTQEPYGWTIHFKDSVSDSAVFEAQMKNCACVLLALTDNLGEVTWTYTVETEEKAVERQSVWTAQEASRYLGAPVKSFRESPQKVQELLDTLSLR